MKGFVGGVVLVMLCVSPAQGSPRYDLERRMPYTLVERDGEAREKALQRHMIRNFRDAADQGDAEAQYNLGVMLEKGQGTPRSCAEAAQWYRLAADQGFALAQYNLGVLYLQGTGVPHREREATRWFRKAAEQGFAEAQYNLGVMYKDGRGVARDVLQAYVWITLAAGQGIPQAMAWRNFFDKVIPADHLAPAREKARRWKPVQRVTH
ncbi:MAG: sel1 repeat family protein [Magnetococcales bacterium]|nr:sel1 repeat family protein [Magnetococcales bacterium]